MTEGHPGTVKVYLSHGMVTMILHALMGSCHDRLCFTAGGVGLAALPVLHRLNCEAYTTAGAPSKRVLLRSLGSQAVDTSRSLAFVDTFACCVFSIPQHEPTPSGAPPPAATEHPPAGSGHPSKVGAHKGGLAAVLNSLTSPGMVAASMAMLAQGGQVIELGKRDVWSSQRAAQERPDALYHLFALDFFTPAAMHQALIHVARGIALSSVRSARTACHPLAATHSALRQLAGARHVGKVAVRSQAPSMASPAHPFRAGTVVVTGGLGALGSAVAAHAAEQGCRSLLLASRSGLITQQAMDLQQSAGFAAVITISRWDLAVPGGLLHNACIKLPHTFQLNPPVIRMGTTCSWNFHRICLLHCH